jgi:hypothetical protein
MGMLDGKVAFITGAAVASGRRGIQREIVESADILV